MRNFIVRLFANAIALWAAAELVPGIDLSADFAGVLLVALVFGVVNAVLKPIIKLLALPLLFLSLGLFALVINAGLLLLTARLMDGFSVDGFVAALVGSLVVSVVSVVVAGVLKDKK
jgi:putative membrane protein